MFQFGGLGALFGGLSPQKPPRGDGSAFFNRVGQYVHTHTGGMHAFFNFTCLLT